MLICYIEIRQLACMLIGSVITYGGTLRSCCCVDFPYPYSANSLTMFRTTSEAFSMFSRGAMPNRLFSA